MKISIVIKILLVAAIALTIYYMLLPKTKIVMAWSSGDRTDIRSDLATIKSRMERCGASEIGMKLRGDTLTISFHFPKKAHDWKNVLTLTGRFQVAELVRSSELPRVRETILGRFGREVDLRPDISGVDSLFASMALIDRDRHAGLDSLFAQSEIRTALEGKAQLLWGSLPSSYNVNGSPRVGDDLYLVSRSSSPEAQLRNSMIKSAIWMPESDVAKELIELDLTPEGKAVFQRLMKENVGRFLATVVDDRVLEAPMILEPVGSDRFAITGCGSVCQVLADVLPGAPLKCGWKMLVFAGK